MDVIRDGTGDAAHDERWMREQADTLADQREPRARRVRFFYRLAADAVAKLRASVGARTS